MNRRFVLLILIVLLIAGCTPTSSSDIVCDPYGCISLSKFSANISSALNNNVVGYASFVGPLPVVFSGQARTSVDAPAMAMLPDIPTNVASVTKVLTTIAVLQSLAKNNLTIKDKISRFLWPNWHQGPGIDTITFGDLLTHESGFRNCPSDSYAGLQQLISQGITLTTPAAPSYNNCNFSIFREMLPFIEGNTYHGLLIDGPPDVWSANFYINYLNQHVFAPLGITNRQCKPAEPNVVLSYPGTPAPTPAPHGLDWGDMTLICGAGGWVLSAGDLDKVALDLTSGNLLLTDAQKSQMMQQCLGWDCSVGPQPDFVGKNGGYPLPGSKASPPPFALNTFIGIFKCQVPVVLIVNSAIQANDPNLTDIVVQAFNNAGVPSTPGLVQSKCPSGLTQQVLPRTQPTRTERTPAPLPRDTQSPRPPSLIAPLDGATVDCGQVTLTWRPAADPSGVRNYDLELEKLVDRTYVLEKTWNNVEGDSVSFDASCETHYRWRVRATDKAGNQGAWSGYGYFHARVSLTATPTPTSSPRDTQAPRPPNLIAPLDGATVDCGQVTLTWQSAADPSGIRDYDLELEKLVDRTYAAEKTWNNSRGDSVSFDATCDTHYRWRVRATDKAGNQGEWSGYQDFQIRAMIQ